MHWVSRLGVQVILIHTAQKMLCWSDLFLDVQLERKRIWGRNSNSWPQRHRKRRWCFMWPRIKVCVACLCSTEQKVLDRISKSFVELQQHEANITDGIRMQCSCFVRTGLGGRNRERLPRAGHVLLSIATHQALKPLGDQRMNSGLATQMWFLNTFEPSYGGPA